MSRQLGLVLYIVAMVAFVVGVDFAFLRNRFWGRLAFNVGIVMVFGAIYWEVLRTTVKLERKLSPRDRSGACARVQNR